MANLRHRGSARLPVELSAIFASPGEPENRATMLFLHGKGGNASEWRPDAVRAIELGYNVLLPDLRAHGRSGGTLFTLGFLEKEDLALTLAAARDGFGIDPERIGIHACSAGSSVALEFAAGRAGVRAIWLESPFAEPREMARHYLSRATHVPASLLTLTSRWAVARAVARVRRELGAERTGPGLERLDPLAAVARVTAPILLVHGEDDRLVPLRFTRRLAAALPPRSAVWNVGRRRPLPSRERARRDREEGLRPQVGGVLHELFAGLRPDLPAVAGFRRRGSSVLPFNCPHAAEASGPLLRRTVTAGESFGDERTRAKRSIAASSGRCMPGR